MPLVIEGEEEDKSRLKEERIGVAVGGEGYVALVAVGHAAENSQKNEKLGGNA